MRTSLFASAAALGLALAVPAVALADTQAGAAANGHKAMHPNAAEVLPALPAPDLGADATPEQFLQVAQQDVQHHRGGAAQEALERAETRLLDRATAPSRADQPDAAPPVQDISQAIGAVTKRDWRMAGQYIEAALQQAPAEGSGMTATPPHPGATSSAAPHNSLGTQAGYSSALSYSAVYPPASGAAAPVPTISMTQGTTSVPMGGVLPPNGGVSAPNGGVLAPNVP